MQYTTIFIHVAVKMTFSDEKCDIYNASLHSLSSSLD